MNKIYCLWKEQITLKGRVNNFKYFVYSMFANLIFGITFGITDTYDLTILAFPVLVFYVPLIVCLYVRRSQDLGIPSWLMPLIVLTLVMFELYLYALGVYTVFQVVLIFLKGQKNPNRYGMPDI